MSKRQKTRVLSANKLAGLLWPRSSRCFASSDERPRCSSRRCFFGLLAEEAFFVGYSRHRLETARRFCATNTLGTLVFALGNFACLCCSSLVLCRADAHISENGFPSCVCARVTACSHDSWTETLPQSSDAGVLAVTKTPSLLEGGTYKATRQPQTNGRHG